jgi:hypothetical protein
MGTECSSEVSYQLEGTLSQDTVSTLDSTASFKYFPEYRDAEYSEAKSCDEPNAYYRITMRGGLESRPDSEAFVWNQPANSQGLSDRAADKSSSCKRAQ